MGLILLSNGHDPANFTEAQFDDALAKLQQAVDSRPDPPVHRQRLRAGPRQGRHRRLHRLVRRRDPALAEDENVKFVTPESGVMLWSDNMLVPNKATHKANAERLMDYYYEPAGRRRARRVRQLHLPVEGAQEEMEKIDPELADNPLIFPDEATLAKAKVFMALDEDAGDGTTTEKFQQVIGA